MFVVLYSCGRTKLIMLFFQISLGNFVHCTILNVFFQPTRSTFYPSPPCCLPRKAELSGHINKAPSLLLSGWVWPMRSPSGSQRVRHVGWGFHFPGFLPVGTPQSGCVLSAFKTVSCLLGSRIPFSSSLWAWGDNSSATIALKLLQYSLDTSAPTFRTGLCKQLPQHSQPSQSYPNLSLPSVSCWDSVWCQEWPQEPDPPNRILELGWSCI